MIKEQILASTLGRIAVSVREIGQRLRTVLFSPEAAGTLINDQLATLLVTNLCQPNQVFVDIGAHIGSVSSAVAHNNSSATVIAFEAIPTKAAALKKRLRRVEVHACALGDAEGEATFFIDTKRSGYSSLCQPADGQAGIVETKVPVKRLDTVVGSRRVHVVKVDVEGAELRVLRGSEETVSRSRPCIMFESGPGSDGPEYTKEAMWQWFNDHDYDVVVPNRLAHDGPSLDRAGFIESHYYPRRSTNYFGVAREHRRDIRNLARAILGICPETR